MLSGLLMEVQVEQGVLAVHGKHHIPVCGVVCQVVHEVALFLFALWLPAIR